MTDARFNSQNKLEILAKELVGYLTDNDNTRGIHSSLRQAKDKYLETPIGLTAFFVAKKTIHADISSLIDVADGTFNIDKFITQLSTKKEDFLLFYLNELLQKKLPQITYQDNVTLTDFNSLQNYFPIALAAQTLQKMQQEANKSAARRLAELKEIELLQEKRRQEEMQFKQLQEQKLQEEVQVKQLQEQKLQEENEINKLQKETEERRLTEQKKLEQLEERKRQEEMQVKQLQEEKTQKQKEVNTLTIEKEKREASIKKYLPDELTASTIAIALTAVKDHHAEKLEQQKKENELRQMQHMAPGKVNALKQQLAAPNSSSAESEKSPEVEARQRELNQLKAQASNNKAAIGNQLTSLFANRMPQNSNPKPASSTATTPTPTVAASETTTVTTPDSTPKKPAARSAKSIWANPAAAAVARGLGADVPTVEKPEKTNNAGM